MLNGLASRSVCDSVVCPFNSVRHTSILQLRLFKLVHIVVAVALQLPTTASTPGMTRAESMKSGGRYGFADSALDGAIAAREESRLLVTTQLDLHCPETSTSVSFLFIRTATPVRLTKSLNVSKVCILRGRLILVSLSVRRVPEPSITPASVYPDELGVTMEQLETVRLNQQLGNGEIVASGTASTGSATQSLHLSNEYLSSGLEDTDEDEAATTTLTAANSGNLQVSARRTREETLSSFLLLYVLVFHFVELYKMQSGDRTVS